MITKIALLSRIPSSLLRRLPTVTSVGYRMPHKTHFCAGIAGSAVLHATVLFGLSAAPVVTPAKEPPVAARVVWRELSRPPEEAPKPEPETKKAPEPTPATARNSEYARLPELSPNPARDGIHLEVPIRDVGRMPSMAAHLGGIPTGPIPGSVEAGGVLVPIDDLDNRPVVATHAAPRYPFELKRIGATGTVVLRFVVDDRGNVSGVEVVSATHPEFGSAAADAIVKWKFKAGMKDGRRVSTRMELPLKFSLDGGA
ncbi:MAG: energy transducer TonB [Opitutaceae bacterium]|nr:energy transducer TonB [Opitutaceae bacterium]